MRWYVLYTGVYQLAVALLGDLPPEWHIIYGIFTCLIGLLLLLILFAPFVFAYQFLGGKKWQL